ncbi:unnamed protein product [Cylicocyclus nassatus]|uniref:Hexosyltransferase n=1 Tax=Cylicocyclus nassatus TaxID=53992 RepID=A0AA36H517_CYLNA|nr:unnamed protein product [Cylicocyclus nassatus]
MSACSNFTSPGIAQAYLLILITLLFYLEMTKMPLECYMQTRSARQRRLDYDPTFLLAPDQNFCKDHDHLMVYQTRTDDFEGRAFFRKVFSNYSSQHNFTIIFPLGLSSNLTVNEALFEEHTRFGDLLQADFLDTYRNLTFKTYAYSRFISRNCTNVLAVIKVDDDIVFNIEWMFSYLSGINRTTNTLHCRTVEKPFSIRDKTSKWYISEKDYPFQYFPKYCLSPLIAGTPATFKALHDATTKIPHVWLDDVFSTGLVAKEAGVTFRNLSINIDSDYSPFLARTVIAQYLNKTDDMTMLLKAMESKVISRPL